MPIAPAVVVGGGAAGFFAAIRARELNPRRSVMLLEASNHPLAKVKVSGGGRCNVTHHCFEVPQLLTNYPRGNKALRPLFMRFNAQQTIDWFAQRGVKLKTEADGRMFPITDSSSTIVDCLFSEAKRLGVEIHLGCNVRSITRAIEDGQQVFELDTTGAKPSGSSSLMAARLLLATGGSPKPYAWLKQLGHHPVDPVPSLFTFKVNDPSLTQLAGVSMPKVAVTLNVNPAIKQEGPILVTHWGLSGPAILKLSAWGARVLAETNHQAELLINWLPHLNFNEVFEALSNKKTGADRRKLVAKGAMFEIPQRLWTWLVGPLAEHSWESIGDKRLQALAEKLRRWPIEISGKGQFKEEFVVAGGVPLEELDLTTLQSKVAKGLYIAGELLNVDGVTGGFNFQNAWSSGWIAGQGLAES